jgi:DUF4097 and DUF4098 domain-containing protein YvlB
VTRVDVATTNGAVEVQGARGLVDIATVSGEVRARDVRGELRVESVSGKVDIDEVALDVARVSTVSSKVELAATLRRGPHRIETASGEVRVTVPRDAALRIFVTSFSGDIVDELGRGRESHARKHGRELGKGGGTLEIATFSGKVTLGAR